MKKNEVVSSSSSSCGVEMDSQLPKAAAPAQAPPAHGAMPHRREASPEVLASLILRGIALVLTLVAVILMGATSKKVTIEYTDFYTGFFVKQSLKFKSTQSAAFVYFIIANVFVLVYTIPSLAISFINKTGASKGLDLVLSLGDVLMLALIFSSNGAASAVILIADKGQKHFGWGEFCSDDRLSSFCGSIKAAIVLSMFAAVAYTLLVLLKLSALHKKTQYV